MGKILLQDSFTVWDPKHILKKGKERHLFLFEQALLLCKEIKDVNGKCTFDYKCKLKTSEMGITEYVAEDKCKFAAWTGNPPLTEEKRIIKVISFFSIGLRHKINGSIVCRHEVNSLNFKKIDGVAGGGGGGGWITFVFWKCVHVSRHCFTQILDEEFPVYLAHINY